MPRSSCDRCTRPPVDCMCHLIRLLPNQWPVLVVQHAREARHPLNTARIAQLCLQRCTTLVAVDGMAMQRPAALGEPGSQPVLIYPGEGSRPVEELALDAPVPLVFIDASWRKSYRLLQEQPWLQTLPRYRIDSQTLSRYRIRKEPKPGYLSTLETIVEVLAPREAANVAGMLEIMDWMVDRQIAAMGHTTWQGNY